MPITFISIRMLISDSQDLKREFVTELIYPAVQANAIYEVLLSFEGSSLLPAKNRYFV